MSRVLASALLAALALALAACGGTGASAAAVAGDVAGIVPADAPLLLAIETESAMPRVRSTTASLSLPQRGWSSRA